MSTTETLDREAGYDITTEPTYGRELKQRLANISSIFGGILQGLEDRESTIDAIDRRKCRNTEGLNKFVRLEFRSYGKYFSDEVVVLSGEDYAGGDCLEMKEYQDLLERITSLPNKIKFRKQGGITEESKKEIREIRECIGGLQQKISDTVETEEGLRQLLEKYGPSDRNGYQDKHR